MVLFTVEPKEKVGLFAVRKDDGLKPRLIVDARRSNLRFRPCPNVNLFSSEGFSKSEVDPGVMPAAWFGITDIKDSFHNMLIPEWLSDFSVYLGVIATTQQEADIVLEQWKNHITENGLSLNKPELTQKVKSFGVELDGVTVGKSRGRFAAQIISRSHRGTQRVASDLRKRKFAK